MAGNSTQESLLKSLGSFGGTHATGVSNITGSYICISALTDTTVLSETSGNIENATNMVIPAGINVLGEWSVVHTSGDCIIYKQ